MARETKLAFIGGTGPEGLGLAMRFAKVGNQVFIGSRSQERAVEAAAKVKEKLPEAKVRGLNNSEAVQRASVVFLTVPFSAHAEILDQLRDDIADKVLIDVVVPLTQDGEGMQVIEVEEGSAAQQARTLAKRAKVVSAFHHLDAGDLRQIDKPMQGDVIVCSDHKGAKSKVMDLAEKIEYVRALDGGGLANCRYLEGWTALLISINKTYRAHTGVRVVGL